MLWDGARGCTFEHCRGEAEILGLGAKVPDAHGGVDGRGGEERVVRVHGQVGDLGTVPTARAQEEPRVDGPHLHQVVV
eukprot:4715820-Pyramimonas_sp.AAC.2